MIRGAVMTKSANRSKKKLVVNSSSDMNDILDHEPIISHIRLLSFSVTSFNMSYIIWISTLIVDGNRVLLVHEKKEVNYGKINFPGGHLELGETVIE